MKCIQKMMKAIDDAKHWAHNWIKTYACTRLIQNSHSINSKFCFIFHSWLDGSTCYLIRFFNSFPLMYKTPKFHEQIN